jgi:predicted RNase H-like HicB family nuclease
MDVLVRLYQDEDGVWIAEVPSIPGCGSDGATRDEALANVKEAIEACLEVRRDLGMPLQIELVTVHVAA